MARMTEEAALRQQIKELRERANRTEDAVSSTEGPSSQEWVSPERRSHYMGMATQDRLEADRLERQLGKK